MLDLAIVHLAAGRAALLMEVMQVFEFQAVELDVRALQAELAAGGAGYIKLATGVIDARRAGLEPKHLALRSYQVMSVLQITAFVDQWQTAGRAGLGEIGRRVHRRAHVAALDNCDNSDVGVPLGIDRVFPNRVLHTRIADPPVRYRSLPAVAEGWVGHPRPRVLLGRLQSYVFAVICLDGDRGGGRAAFFPTNQGRIGAGTKVDGVARPNPLMGLVERGERPLDVPGLLSSPSGATKKTSP